MVCLITRIWATRKYGAMAGHGRTDGRTHRRTDVRKDGQMDVQMDGRTYERTDRWTNVWTYGWTDGWTYGRIDVGQQSNPIWAELPLTDIESSIFVQFQNCAIKIQ